MAPTVMETILGGITTITTVVGDVWDMMIANPLLTVFIASSLVAVGISVFASIKSVAR